MHYSGAMKKTCQACAASKVKCCGGTPCARCIKRGDSCSYQPEQKRGRRPNTDLVLAVAPPAAPAFAPPAKRARVLDAACPLPTYPRRLFRVLFSLLKFHSARDDDAWFAAKLRVLALPVANDAFDRWLLARFPLLPASLLVPAFALVNLASVALPNPGPTNRTYLGGLQVCTLTSACRCSPELSQYLGYDATGSNFPHGSAVWPTVLPFGGNVLAQIASTDSLVLQFVREAFLRRDAQLVDFPMTLRSATGTTVRCAMSWRRLSGTSECWFEFYAPAAATTLPLPVIPLPDLELGPWVEVDWLPSLCTWADV